MSNNAAGFWLVIAMCVATGILYLVLVGGEEWKDFTRWQDWDDIEHRKEGMAALKHIYEEAHHDNQPIPGVQQGGESPDHQG